MSGIAVFLVAQGHAGPGDAPCLRRGPESAGIRPDVRGRDTGCGTGAALTALTEAVPPGRPVAGDTSAPFVERMRARDPGIDAYGDFAGDAVRTEGFCDGIALWQVQGARYDPRLITAPPALSGLS